MQITDGEALKKIKNGEIDYFSEIVSKYTGNIHRYIKSKLFEKDDVDDLVQNTFVSFYKAIDRFDETRPILPYLYQIAKNEMKMYFRSRKETVVLDEAILVDKEENDYYKGDYEGLLQKLSKEQREILQLFEEGYSYKEIAEKVNRPLNTVRTVIRRSRLQIKKIYYEKT